MSIKINGVEPQKILVDENGKITELTRLKVYKDGQYKCGWTKPYTLTISRGGHSTVTVGYKADKDSPITKELYNGNTITHGCYLNITVTGHQGYSVTWKINGVTQSSANAVIEVTDNINISVTETVNIVYLSYPVISGTFTYNSSANSYYLTYSVTNKNSCEVNANTAVYSDGDCLDGSRSVSIPANSTWTCKHGEMYSMGAKVTAMFSCSGYGDSSSSTTFGKYTGAAGSPDETTSTTS